MARTHLQLQQIEVLKRESERQGCRLSTILEDKQRKTREYFAFINGELELYDTIGGAPDQVPLTREEILVVRELDQYGIRILDQATETKTWRSNNHDLPANRSTRRRTFTQPSQIS